MNKVRETHCIHPADVARAKLGRTEARELEGVAALLGAMADPTRVRILDALRMGELCVGDLAAVLQMTVSAVSHQLRLLRTARLVRARKEGKVVFYVLDDEHVERILDIALDHCRERGAR
ncbi:MAG TPA: transcriptional regulator [Desulfomicrobium sp.]|nr:transcriptional regulator [Desulfomicrobium sp.]